MIEDEIGKPIVDPEKLAVAALRYMAGREQVIGAHALRIELYAAAKSLEMSDSDVEQMLMVVGMMNQRVAA